MTTSFRTPTAIRADIDAQSKRIDVIDAGKQELYSAAGDETALDWHIVGFNDGTGLDALGVRRGVVHARLYPTKALAERAERRNDNGGWAIAIPYGRAIDIALELQWRRYDDACKVFHALHEELAIVQQIERDDAEAAMLDAAADKAAFEDECKAKAEERYADEYDRKNYWSLRAVARRIADSGTEYEG